MKILAIICAYNEADIIGWTVRHLKRQGCEVFVIDCQSTDDTQAVAREAGAMIHVYQRPPVSWHALLGEVEKICAFRSTRAYDWCMLCDADELRCDGLLASRIIETSNRSGFTLAEGFECVQAAGFNAVDFYVMTFHPTADSAEFDGSQDPEQYFRFYSADPLNQRIGQVKAWRNVGPVSLAASGGHQVQFPGRRVYPVKFLSKHYPIRSQAHGERKVFQERKWLDQSQGRKYWHVQYDGIVPGHSFLKDPKKKYLMEWK